jgi:uncharacterized membrane protein required for colicin V production
MTFVNTIDLILVGFVALIAILGFIRGVVSQAMSIFGLIAAYFFSTQLSNFFVDRIAHEFGSSQNYARPFSVLWAAILIYIVCRLIGFAVEKILINQSGSLKTLNRVGGGLLGAVKGCLILIIGFYILRLVPKEKLETHAPRIPQSRMYQFFAKNELLDTKYIDTLVEPVAKPVEEMIHSKTEKLPGQTAKSVTHPKSKKIVEKTESKMNNEELDKVLMKHVSDSKKPEK